jgi:hypothetical protein
VSRAKSSLPVGRHHHSLCDGIHRRNTRDDRIATSAGRSGCHVSSRAMGRKRLCSFSWRTDRCRRRSWRPVRAANICHGDGDICSGVSCLCSCDVCRMVDRRSQRTRYWSSATCAAEPCYCRSGLSEDSSRTRYWHLGRGIGNYDLLGPGPWRLSDRCAPLACDFFDQPASIRSCHCSCASLRSREPERYGLGAARLAWRSACPCSLRVTCSRTYLNIGNLRRERTCHPGTLFWRHRIGPFRFSRSSGSQPHYAVVAVRKSRFLERKHNHTFSLRRPDGDPFLAAFRPN